MENRNLPNYKCIYNDILKMYPEKENKCRFILNKTTISSLDIITLNNIIFENKDVETEIFNQKHKSYDENTIKEILEYQKKYKLNNSQLALHYKLSRNTVRVWKKNYNY